VAEGGATFANSSCSYEQFPSCQHLRSRFYRELPYIYTIAFFGDHRKVKFAVGSTLEAEIWLFAVKIVRADAVTRKRDFYVGLLQ
jgi:hypothetical protein